MDLTKLKEAYPKFLLLLKDRGYKATTIEKYQWAINRLLSEAQVSDIRSFEDYFFLLKGKLSAKSLPEVKTYLGALKHYVESGVFHRDHSYDTVGWQLLLQHKYQIRISKDKLPPIRKTILNQSAPNNLDGHIIHLEESGEDLPN